jgi:DTW domain-containing protein YfiP
MVASGWETQAMESEEIGTFLEVIPNQSLPSEALVGYKVRKSPMTASSHCVQEVRRTSFVGS